MAKRKRSTSLSWKTKRSRSNPDEHIVEEAPTSVPLIEKTMVTQTQRLSSALSNGIVVTAKRITRSVTRQTQQISTDNIEDVISEDGILCTIISSLPLREAIRTSVLSPRWKNLWTSLPILKFNAANVLEADTACLVQHANNTITSTEKLDLIEENREQFIRSVNSIVQRRHNEAILDEFWIRYFISNIHSNHLDSWIHFAVTAKTKQLNVQLHRPFLFVAIEEDAYEFPFHLLGFSSSIEILNLSCCYVRPPRNFDGLRHLRELDLAYIDIIEEDINNLLYNCYSLQTLSLWNSPRLVTLSIPDSLIQFQNLKVKFCEQLREIKINPLRFSKLCYLGHPVDFIVRQSLHLKHARVLFRVKESQHNLDYYLNKLSRELPHIEILCSLIDGVSEVADLPKGFNSFIHLRQLEWIWDVKTSLLFLSNVLDAAPLVEELKLHCATRFVEPPPPGLSELKEKLPKRHRSHLKTIEINGFYFDLWQIEIALYLLNNATELETLKLKGCHPLLPEIREADIMCFSQEVPSNVKLLIFKSV